jgi:hypothetical protein
MRWAATAIVVATAIAGCGTNDGGGAATSSAATDAAYATNADAICAEANKREYAAGAKGAGWIYAEQFDDVDYLERFVAPGREALRKLRALEVPVDEREAAAEMLSALETLVRSIDGRINDLKSHSGDASERIRAYLDAFGDLTPAAAVLGLSECQGLVL